MNFAKYGAFGAVAAVVGALVWGGIAYATNYEIGWIAIGIGILVGFAVVVGGGKGGNAALIAGALALASICGGKVLAMNWTMDNAFAEIARDYLTEDVYEEFKANAASYAKVTTEAEKRIFMVQTGYTDAPTPNQIPAEEIAEFDEYSVPELIAFNNKQPSFNQWRGETLQELRSYMDIEYSYWARLKDTLGFMDIVFFLLGVGAAFQLVARDDRL